MTKIQNDSKIVDWIYNCTPGTTFSIQFGENLNMTKYATISGGPFRDTKDYYHSNLAEPYDVVCRIDVRKDPSADYVEQHSISYDPEEEVAYIKRGVNRFNRLQNIQTDALEADYDSSRKLVIICDECGSKIDLPENNRPSVSAKGMEKNVDDETVTPCCRSTHWTTKLE